jgi:hypothetical protein
LNKNGTASIDATTYNLAAAGSWQLSAVADATTPITVSNAAAVITSSTYDVTTGNLVLTGANFDTGATIDVTKLNITGQASVTRTLTVSESGTPTITNATSATVVVAGADKAAVDVLLDKNGTSSTDATPYNLAAGATWYPSAAADATTPIVVSGIP